MSKKNFLQLAIFLSIVFLLNSCLKAGVCWVEPSFTQEAERLYNSIGTRKISVSDEEGQKLFGSCYRSIDRVFVFQNFYRKKYILVKNGEPYTYVEEDKFFGF